MFGFQLKLFSVSKRLFSRKPAPAPIVRAPRVRASTLVTSPSRELLVKTWNSLRNEYFPNRPDLDQYTIVWSSRPQRRTLASVSLERHRVIVAAELNYPEHYQWLPALIYHEMCHAVLGESLRRASGRTAWHGREFRALEAKHPGIPALDLWISSGGWNRAVRSHRTKSWWATRRA